MLNWYTLHDDVECQLRLVTPIMDTESYNANVDLSYRPMKLFSIKCQFDTARDLAFGTRLPMLIVHETCTRRRSKNYDLQLVLLPLNILRGIAKDECWRGRRHAIGVWGRCWRPWSPNATDSFGGISIQSDRLRLLAKLDCRAPRASHRATSSLSLMEDITRWNLLPTR